MRTALLQLSSTDQPRDNLDTVLNMVEEAAKQGARFILTPEVTNCVSTSRQHQIDVLTREDDDPLLSELRVAAARFGVWILVGSLALKTEDPDGRFANRSVLIGPEGQVHARYDKIHMFDVDISDSNSYRESSGYRPGNRAVLAQTDFGAVGLTICYDLRFPHLYRTLAQAGAHIITVPSAFSRPTGAAHWHTLLRARAIETGCFILAPAQTGTHAQSGSSPPRQTFGHSLVVSPWGQVLSDAGLETGLTLVDLNLSDVDKTRKRVPSLYSDQDFEGPDV